VYGAEAGNSSFDLIGYKAGFLLRIEVKGDGKKVNTYSPCGCVPSNQNRSVPDCRKFDVLAVVEGSSVRYLRSVYHNFNAASRELVGEELQNKYMRTDLRSRRDRLVEEMLH
jgi:hypothetical protein